MCWLPASASLSLFRRQGVLVQRGVTVSPNQGRRGPASTARAGGAGRITSGTLHLATSSVPASDALVTLLVTGARNSSHNRHIPRRGSFFAARIDVKFAGVFSRRSHSFVYEDRSRAGNADRHCFQLGHGAGTVWRNRR